MAGLYWASKVLKLYHLVLAHVYMATFDTEHLKIIFMVTKIIFPKPPPAEAPKLAEKLICAAKRRILAIWW